MAAKPQIGFCGLGAMGFGMATHLVKQGYPVKGFDVFLESLERFQGAGGMPTTSLADSASESDYYICMVATAIQAQAALFEQTDSIVKALPQKATLLLCSTVPASYARSVEEQLRSMGRGDVYFIDCPVSGGAIRAANGTLSIMAGAREECLAKGKFLLELLTDENKLYLVPGGVGQGSNMKMVHQVLAAIHILAASEAMGFAARLGLNADEVRHALLESKARSWMFENRSPRMLTQDYFPGVSALTIILKDTGIITASARGIGFPAALCTVAEQMYLLGFAQGFGGDDDAGLVRLYYPKPLTEIEEGIRPEEKRRNTQLVIELLSAIHLCAAAEAISFAQTLDLPMDQFFELVSNAAGSSTIFKRWYNVLSTRSKNVPGSLLDQVSTNDLQAIHKGVTEAADAAQTVKCPLPLATAAMDILLSVSRLSAQRPQ